MLLEKDIKLSKCCNVKGEMFEHNVSTCSVEQLVFRVFCPSCKKTTDWECSPIDAIKYWNKANSSLKIKNAPKLLDKVI